MIWSVTTSRATTITSTTTTTKTTTKLSALGASDKHLLTTTKYDMISNNKKGYKNNINYNKNDNNNNVNSNYYNKRI